MFYFKLSQVFGGADDTSHCNAIIDLDNIKTFTVEKKYIETWKGYKIKYQFIINGRCVFTGCVESIAVYNHGDFDEEETDIKENKAYMVFDSYEKAISKYLMNKNKVN